MGTLNPQRWRAIRDVLDAYDELPAAERAGFLETACRGDPALRRQVEALLGNEDKIESFLDRPLLPLRGENLAGAVLVPRVGPYRLVRELGEGGMGTVYLALQEEPFRRQVALKLVQQRVASPGTVERFHAERQILAGIKHPNVAQLYDGGTAPDGRPYFAMEYVEGEPIQDYCDARRLGVEERLGLFSQVCSAVHLAHQKLRVVHRDLKPGNILVTDDGIPKLLDFGIARSLDPGTGWSSVQEDGSPPGPVSVFTPHYSSPEQLAGLPLSTASDIYSLGVLLYQLLTGRLPYRSEATDPESIRRLIESREPERPSDVARAAGVPGRLSRRLAGDLDAITLRALAQAPENRYSSVEQLAEDIRRHLTDRPVLARAPSWLYRAGKFVRRHRIGLTAAVAVVSLAVFLILAQAREIAEVRRVSSSLVDLLKALQPATPDQKVELEAALAKASDLVHDPMFAGHPADQATLMDALGRAYTSLGQYEQAEKLLEQALETRRRDLGETHVLVAESLNNLAFLYQRMGQTARAEGHLQRSLKIRYGSGDPDLRELSLGVNNLAITLYDRGYYAEAEALFRRVLDLRLGLYGTEHPDVVRARSNLAAVLVEQGAYAEAEALFRQNLEIRGRPHGPEHRDVATSRNQLGTVLYAQGKLEEAEVEVREALRIRREVYGADHPNVALVLNNLGTVLQARGALADSEAAYREALAVLIKKVEDGHLYLAVTKRNLAAVLSARGEVEEAGGLAREALASLRASMAPDSWRIADAESVYGGCLVAEGRFAEAEELLKKSFETIRAARGEWAPYTRDAARRIAALYEAWQRPEEAETYRRAAAARPKG